MNTSWMKKVAVVTLWALFVVLWAARAGKLDPPAAPAPTMKTLDQVGTWSVQISDVSSRYVVLPDFGNQAVLDRETGLVWAQAENPWDDSWNNANQTCIGNVRAGRNGWRLPTISELSSVGAQGQLPNGHPFSVSNKPYWSSTLLESGYAMCWNPLGHVAPGSCGRTGDPIPTQGIWCVRGPK